jgi:hypothetical protein
VIRVSARVLELNNLAVLQVAQTQSARSGDENVEHRPAQAEATRLASGCVRATVVDAFSYNFRVSIVEDCTFDRGQASHAINLFDMSQKYADVVSLAETREYLQGLPEGLFDARMPALRRGAPAGV